ncbi:MAG TPA: retroviral-like aspartic protease family protein [Syntrophales bacterium]|nr:retroviral-like aspartic protease family protein [Syntrophales bacterium]HPC33157.1 retroviral-like aspartic protease family protein [Syntrophales bacterium]
MIKRRWVRWIMLPLLPVILALPAGGAAIYQWVDQRGIIHASSSPEDVPPAYRDRAAVMETPVAAAAADDRVGAEYLIPFERSATGIILVEAVFNGHARAKMVLDTGASVVLISEAFAARMRLGADAGGGRRALLKTAGGDVEGRSVTIARLEVGDAVREAVPAAISPKNQVFEGFDGLLGLSFLGNFRVTIDYRNSLIVLKEPPYLQGGHNER